MPATPNRPARLNRGLLTLVGILLLLGGAYTLTRGLGLPPAIGPFPAQDPGAALVAGGLAVPTWVVYVVIVAAVVIGVLSLLWLVAQIGRRRASSQTWRLPGDHSGGTTMLDTDAAAAAVAEDIEAYPGVHRAGAAITGDRTRPFLHLTVTTEDDVSLTDIRQRIATEALTRLRAALEIDELPTEILLRLGTAPANRIS
jgi:hypothetical protein